MSNLRLEIDHNGNIVNKVTELSDKLGVLIHDLFSQNGYTYAESEISGAYRKVSLSNNLGDSYTINLYSGNVRNEDRQPYEKKIQLGGKDPREKIDEFTIIIGLYVFNKNDDIKDALVVAFPIEEEKKYPGNPSLRPIHVEKTLQSAKIKGFYFDKENLIAAFRPEFIFFYLDNYRKIHKYPEQSTISCFAHNRILFGAPGTGKSFRIEEDRKAFKENYDRVTFHPNYSYAQFVGTYKPKPKTKSGNEYITYEYVPGPFLRLLINAMKSKKNNDGKNYLLIVEEINRANVAAVFGDVFQLLDRNEDGTSEYSVTTTEDMRDYLVNECKFARDEVMSIKLPNNFYIWATMNSADQGVFPIDTAFKRRWTFEYLGINEGESKIKNKKVTVKAGQGVLWNDFRKAINAKLIALNVNEDKQLGPFFLSQNDLEEKNFDKAFKSKVLMYLYEDVLKHKKKDFFKSEINTDAYKGGISTNTYSEVLAEYSKHGGAIFDFELHYINEASEESEEDDDGSGGDGAAPGGDGTTTGGQVATPGSEGTTTEVEDAKPEDIKPEG